MKFKNFNYVHTIKECTKNNS